MRTALSLYLVQRGADFLIAVKHCRCKWFRLIRDRLSYGRQFPWRTSKREIKRVVNGIQIMATLKTSKGLLRLLGWQEPANKQSSG